jgi:hypothetical protein
MEDLALLIVKNHLHMHFVENQWLKCFSLHLCLIVVLPPRKKFHKRFCLSWRKKLYVLPCLAKCFFATSFYLWMSKGIYDSFALVINFLGTNWQPKHITIGLFETMDTYGQTLAKDLIELL